MSEIDEMITESFENRATNEETNEEVTEEVTEENKEDTEKEVTEIKKEDNTNDEVNKNKVKEEEVNIKKTKYQKRIDTFYKKTKIQESLIKGLNKKNQEQSEKLLQFQEKYGEISELQKPKIEDYTEEKVDEYYKDNAYYELNQKVNQEKEQIILQEKEQKWVEKIRDAESSYKDFSETMKKIENIPVSSDLSKVIQDSTTGAHVLYWLGQNIEIAQQLSQLPPTEQLIKYGVIESNLKKIINTKKTKNEISKATKPINTINTKVEKLGELSGDEFLKNYKKTHKQLF